jgi:hypothetical protein
LTSARTVAADDAMSKFDRDVDRLKERLQDRHERKLGRLCREAVEFKERLDNAEALNIVLGGLIACALALWLLL